MMTGVERDIYTIQIPLHRRCETSSPFCEACKNGVVHLSSLEVRKFTETGKLPNVCKTCTKEFLRICRIQLRSLNERETTHSCEMCGRSFIHAGNLKKHKALHEPSKASTSKDSQDVSDLINGQAEEIVKQERDEDQTSSTYVGFETRACICKECGTDFSNEYAFLKHCQFHSIKKMFACGLCNQLFEDLDRQKIHSLSHEEKSEYICNICPLTFVKMVELKNHCLSTHEKIFQQQDMELDSAAKKQVFSCNLCNKTFLQRGAYLRHCEQHVNQPQFVCKMCSKIFTSERRLTTHEVLHKKTHASSSKGKRFTCKVCNKHFKLRKTFMKHRGTHK